MRASARRPSMSRIIIAVVIALVAIARGGGVAIACESASSIASPSGARGDDHSSMPQHDEPEHDGCDEPERVSECLLMPACAPAVSASASDADASSPAATTIAVNSPRAPAPVDRAPEPPPPRASRA